MWIGDWAKGHAGGYGTDESDWRGQYDIWDHKAGMIAEKTEWSVDPATGMGTIVYTIRQGVYWSLNPISEASKKVGGRQMDADDVVYYLNREVTDERSYLWRSNMPLREAVIEKTGPWEVSLTVPQETLITAIFRLGDVAKIGPRELADSNLSDWRDTSFGTGPYMTTDYVPASAVTMVRNDNYWETNPVGPGKGDQLPYIDNVKMLIILDASTRMAAMRTGKIDRNIYDLDDAILARKENPELLEEVGGPSMALGSPESIDLPGDVPEFSDVRVRRALWMATDLNAINEGLYDGLGILESWPFTGVRGYDKLRIKYDDPDIPASVKECYDYNPEKAKALMAEAGYPDGFKTKVLTDSVAADFWSIIKDQWSKVGVTLELDVVEWGAKQSILNTTWYMGITDGGMAVDSAFHTTPTLTGTPGLANTARIFDPKIDAWLENIRSIIIAEGTMAGIVEAREMVKYAQEQAYAIPVPYVWKYHMWWPWLKNYTGEESVGYFNSPNWITYTWIDQDLKKEMGY
ncbi:ABC transporter substrate-binding protein [Chloroflexota bacterium]